MPNADLSQILQIVSLVASAVLILRLLTTGLWKRYPIFFWYFVFRIPNTLWPLVIPYHSIRYQHAWMLTEPIADLFHVFVVYELCRLVLQNHRGIFTLGRWAMYVSVVIAIGISILTFALPHLRLAKTDDTRRQVYEIAVDRGIDFALAIFLLLLLFFLSRYPVKLNRNVVTHATLYSLFFFGQGFSLFLRTLFGIPAKDWTNLLASMLSCACVVGWIFLLSPEGEERKGQFPLMNPRREQAALRQLEILNMTLLKISRK